MQKINRIERFTFVVTPSERLKIDALAAKMNRSRSDAVRLAVMTAAQILDEFPDAINLSREAVVESPATH